MMIKENEVQNWLAFQSILGVGPVLIKRLMETYGSLPKVLELDHQTLINFEGIGPTLAQAILSCRIDEKVKREYEKIEKCGIDIICLTDARYPSLLKEIYDPPPLLYFRGKRQIKNPAIAVVGSRRATSYGRMITARFTRELSDKGYAIISGMARGIDGYAHREAIRVKGETFAVLGCGLDLVYPPEHRDLMENIMEQGGVLSEYPLGTPPDAKNFPQRNRIISGLALGVLVIEAASESGSLITARLALEQGREVFAVPGNIGMKSSEGTNRLIKNGAKLVQGSEDILEEILPEFRLSGKKVHEVFHSTTPSPEIKRSDMEIDESILFDLVGTHPAHIDELCTKSHFPSNKVSGLLLKLELKGFVQQMAGQFYSRAQ